MAESDRPEPSTTTRRRRTRKPSAADLERARQEREDRQEREELGALRAMSIKVFLGLSVALVMMDALGRLFRDPAFSINPLVFGMVFGTLLALLGLEGAAKLLGGK